ncbi:MAG: hypothetical protein HYR73_00225 [Candidatus Eisenbacteria bacterium]|nr:hypothetical protein [Candidatus Eisenbacteria bacterium]
MRGNVRFTTLSPGRDCFVTLFRKIIPPPPPGDPLHFDFVVSDSLGRFEFDGVPPGVYGLYTTYFSAVTFSDSLFAGDTVVVRATSGVVTARPLTLRAGGVFLGFVKDAGTKAPASAWLLVDGFPILGVTDSTGAYALGGIPPGTWFLLAVVPDSLAPESGQSPATMPAPGDTVRLPALLVSSHLSASGPSNARAALDRTRAIRTEWRRSWILSQTRALRSLPR